MNNRMPQQAILRRLKDAFPEAITEQQHQTEDGKLFYTYAVKPEFIEQLQKAGLDIADDQNRYELQFPGKQLAKAAAFVPCYKTLRADKAQSKNFDETGNLFIEGDNLDALRMLQKSYRGKVKVIYIDPPYNTGGDDFVYNDDFSVVEKEYLRQAGIVDEDGEKQIDQVRDGLKGRFHAGWLAFMYPRLKLARELLSEDGVIFISIDDNEHANLKLICDEVFGEENFIENFCWNKTQTPPSLSHKSRKDIDYVLCYEKQRNDKTFFGKPSKNLDAALINRGNAQNELTFPPQTIRFNISDGIYVKGEYGNVEILQDFSVKNGTNKTEVKISAEFGWGQKKLLQEISMGTYFLVKSKKMSIRYQKSDRDFRPLPPRKLIAAEDAATNETASNEVTGLGIVFSFPKPVRFAKYLLNMILYNNKEATVLDFFAGSATTAHAVMQLNAEDGGNRKFILVQLPETIDPKKSKEAHEFCTKQLNRPATIAEIAKERIRRAGERIAAEQPENQSAIDAGFRAFVIEDSLFTKRKEEPLMETEQAELKAYTVNLTADQFEPLLYQAMLETGAALDQPLLLSKVKTYPFAICARNCYCVTENLTQAIVQTIAQKHGDEFDVLYYLTDALNETTSFTEIEAALKLSAANKQLEGLAFY